MCERILHKRNQYINFNKPQDHAREGRYMYEYKHAQRGS